MDEKHREDEIAAFWNACRARLSDENPAYRQDIPEAWSFGDGSDMADELGALVMDGRKTATCGALWEYEAENEAIPEPGQYSIILDGAGRPLCLIEVLEVRVLPFNEVDAKFAFDEGEGDRTLAFWRSAHWDFFSRSLAEIGRKPTRDMPLVCERFRVVFRASDLLGDKTD